MSDRIPLDSDRIPPSSGPGGWRPAAAAAPSPPRRRHEVREATRVPTVGRRVGARPARRSRRVAVAWPRTFGDPRRNPGPAAPSRDALTSFNSTIANPVVFRGSGPLGRRGHFSEIKTGPLRGCLKSHRDAADSNLNGTLPLATSVMTSERMNGVLLLVCPRTTTILIVLGPGKRSTLLAPRGFAPKRQCEYPMGQYAALLPTRTTRARPVDIWGIKTSRMPFKSEKNQQKSPILTPQIGTQLDLGVAR